MKRRIPPHLAALRARYAAEFDARASTSHPFTSTTLIMLDASAQVEVQRRIEDERRYADERPMRRARRP